MLRAFTNFSPSGEQNIALSDACIYTVKLPRGVLNSIIPTEWGGFHFRRTLECPHSPLTLRDRHRTLKRVETWKHEDRVAGRGDGRSEAALFFNFRFTKSTEKKAREGENIYFT